MAFVLFGGYFAIRESTKALISASVTMFSVSMATMILLTHLSDTKFLKLADGYQNRLVFKYVSGGDRC